MLKTKVKAAIIADHRVHEKDTGSANVQVGLLSKEIDRLASHLKKHRKDNHSRRGLLGMVAHRRKLLKYLEENDAKAYTRTIKKLGLKK